MPVATGSISFLGASRFQGKWDAIGNDGTGSQLAGSPSSNYADLLTATVAGGGYHSQTNLTASQGDYWQIWRSDTTPSNNTTVNGVNNWSVNDWIIYSGSQWIKLPFEDTIASIVTGDMTSSSFHMGTANDTHIIFAKSNVHSGSKDFVYDYTNSRVGIGTTSPSNQLEIEGSSGDLIFEMDNNASNSANFQIQNGAGNARVDLVMNDGSANTIITMKDQKVGIGDTSPSYTLDVLGNGQIATDLFVGDDLSLTSDSAVLNFGAGNDVTFTHDGGTGMDIASAGNLDIDCTAGSVTLGASLADGQTLTLGINSSWHGC